MSDFNYKDLVYDPALIWFDFPLLANGVRLI